MNLDWTSRENTLFLNSKFPETQAAHLRNAVSGALSLLQGHLLLLSSGTTAISADDLKWVALRKEAFLESARAVNQHLKSGSSDVWLHALPDFHVGGLGIWARSYLSGASVIKLHVWSAQNFMTLAQENHVSITALVPAQIFDLVKVGFRSPGSLRAVLVGGGALTPALYRSALALGWPLLPTYGMTETCSQVATASLDSLREGHGAEIPALEVLPHLHVRESSEGLLQIQGSSLLTGYIYCGASSPTLEDPKKENWFLSQDRGIVDGRNLRIIGRSGDFVKIGGESVEMNRLREILDEVRSELAISADLVILPVPDDRLGHVIHLISDSQLSEKDRDLLIKRFNTTVLGFERIRKWHSLNQIPRTALGKLIPSACVEWIQSEAL